MTVDKVVIEGTRAWDQNRVRFLLDVREGRKLSLNELREATSDDLRAIEKMGPFFNNAVDVQPSDDGKSVTVVYRLHELPAVAKVEYRGIGYFDKEKARKLVDTKAGSNLNPLILENDRRAIQAKFEDDGHRYAKVTVETTDEGGNVTVTFVVELDVDIEVAQVNFVGLPRAARPKEVLNGLLNAVGRPYLPEQMPLDEWALIRNLQDLGWLDAKLVKTERQTFDYVRPMEERRRHGPDVAPDGAYNDRVVITYTVDTGERYQLGKVSFIGATHASSEQLRSAFATPEGAWFTKKTMFGDGKPADEDGDLGAIERTRRVISNQGYARCELGYDRVLDTKKHIVDLVLHFDEGRKYRIGRVDIRGNRVTRDAVVRRAMFINPGDLWNDDDIDESKLQVRRTDVFKDSIQRPLRVSPTFPEDRPDEADLNVDVDEDSTGSLRFEVGFSSATGIFGSFSYTERNFDLIGTLTGQAFRGAGQILQFEVSGSKDTKSASTTWTNPHLADGAYSLSTTGAYSTSRQLEWDERRITGSTTIGRYFLKNDLNVGLTYTASDIKVKNVQLNAPNDAREDDFYQNTVGVGLTYDQLRPRRSQPTSGYLLNANQSFTGWPLPATAKYQEYSLKGEGYVPVFRFDDGGVTYFHLGARWREQHAIDPGDSVPFYQRYRGGGPFPRHRGFDYDKLGPHGTNKNGVEAYEGGNKDALATIEFSVPVQGTNEGVRTVLFFDYGNVWGQGENPKLSDLRSAAGFGIRFPIALPVSLDFAFLLDPRTGDPASQVHFGLGQVRF